MTKYSAQWVSFEWDENLAWMDSPFAIGYYIGIRKRMSRPASADLMISKYFCAPVLQNTEERRVRRSRHEAPDCPPAPAGVSAPVLFGRSEACNAGGEVFRRPGIRIQCNLRYGASTEVLLSLYGEGGQTRPRGARESARGPVPVPWRLGRDL